MSDTRPLLSVRNLKTHFITEQGRVLAVDGVDFDVNRGETVCVVGESGSGKTVTCESIARLFKQPPGEIAGGSIIFDGEDLTKLPEAELREFRGNRISYIFQNPQDALNPVYTVGWQIEEVLRLHRDIPDDALESEVVSLLKKVGIPNAASRAESYPHELSGGMKQRVIIAIALASEPDLLIADEPTTALDVTIQSQILRLLEELTDEYGMTVLFVTHDLGVVAQVADRVVVMYAGKIMEKGSVIDIFESPAHPYTRGLLACLPGRGMQSRPIKGSPPDPRDPPSGCRFHPRCPHAVDECRTDTQPPLVSVTNESHTVSCVYYGPGYDPNELDASPGEYQVGLGNESS